MADHCSFTTRQAVVIRTRRITLDEYTLATDKAKYLALILPGSTLGPLYDYHISNAKKWDWLYSQFVLNMLTPHKNQQIRKYNQFMAEDISEEINRVFDNKYLPSMLGSQKFIQWVKNKFFTQKRHVEVPDSKALGPDSETIMETICTFYKIHRDKLFTVKRGTE